MSLNNNIEIYTDGAYSSNLKKGGIGIVIKIKDKYLTYSKCFINTTNNRMELLAVVYSLNMIPKKVNSIKVYSDSKYVVDSINLNWKRKKNIDVWNEFDKVYNRIKKLCNNIEFIWIKGHADNEYNNICDQIAVEAYINN